MLIRLLEVALFFIIVGAVMTAVDYFNKKRGK